MCPIDCTSLYGKGKVGSVNVTTVVIHFVRPKSVRNRCVIELFCGNKCCYLYFFIIFVYMVYDYIGLLSLH